ncbi:MAG: sugar phosphate isomerase/epimerase [Ruminococcaceae bacterium]|nr:sugar phosphate isomerase/epimerase [Oscillospiraceae bacterium]
MKISVSDIGVPVKDTQMFAYLKECGFDAVDFSFEKYFHRNGIFGDIDNVTDKQIEEYFTNLKSEADKVCFEVGQIHSQFGGHPREYDHNIDEIVKREAACIKAAHWLGCKYVVIHPIIDRRRYYDYYVKENFEQSADFYSRLIPYLEEYDVYGCVENMWMVDPVYTNICSTIFSHAQEMVDMCDRLGERFKICVDVGHGPLTQDDAAEMIRISGDRLAVLHLHDNDGISDLHAYPYSVYQTPYSNAWKPMRIDWDEIIKALDEVNYRGNLNFEISAPGPEEVKKFGYEYLAKIGRYMVSKRTVKY